MVLSNKYIYIYLFNVSSPCKARIYIYIFSTQKKPTENSQLSTHDKMVGFPHPSIKIET